MRRVRGYELDNRGSNLYMELSFSLRIFLYNCSATQPYSSLENIMGGF
jgi:hypothetical protein